MTVTKTSSPLIVWKSGFLAYAISVGDIYPPTILSTLNLFIFFIFLRLVSGDFYDEKTGWLFYFPLPPRSPYIVPLRSYRPVKTAVFPIFRPDILIKNIKTRYDTFFFFNFFYAYIETEKTISYFYTINTTTACFFILYTYVYRYNQFEKIKIQKKPYCGLSVQCHVQYKCTGCPRKMHSPGLTKIIELFFFPSFTTRGDEHWKTFVF